MKISELPHRDPAWAYIELNDGSLVAIPKKAAEELQEESKRLKADLEYARSYKHTIKMRNRNLKTENERLKAELKQMEVQDQVVFCNLREENERLKRENAKLRCLALHGTRDLFCVYMANEYYNLLNRKDEEGKARAKKLYEKFAHLYAKYKEAYRKAKKKLMEAK